MTRGSPASGFRLRVVALSAAMTLAALAVAGCGGEDDIIPAPDCSGSTMIAFASDRNGRSQIFLYDIDLAQYRLLAGLDDGTHGDFDPSITRDGRYVAFESARGSSGIDVHVHDRCAGALAPVAGLNSAGDDTDPAFSGDGVRLAFVRDTLGDRRVRLYDGQNDRFVPLPGIDAAATFDDYAPSPDQSGGKIAFVSNRNGNEDVFVYDASGDTLMVIPELASPEQDTDPALSPDGRWLVFASSRAGGEGLLDLYLYDLQARDLVTLDPEANSPEDDRQPTLSRDSNVIVFASNRTGTLGGPDLWLYLRSSGQVVQPSASGSAAVDEAPSLVWP